MESEIGGSLCEDSDAGLSTRVSVDKTKVNSIVNNYKEPRGRGIMKYDFGFIADGEWACGMLKQNPHDRALSAAELSVQEVKRC